MAIYTSFPEPVNITLYVFAGMGLNLIYAIFNGVIGVTNRSAWCGSLSAYYILLCVMRFLSVSYARKVYDGTVSWGKGHTEKNSRLKKEDSLEVRSWRVHRNCGIILSISSITLGGAVIMLVSGQGGKSYIGRSGSDGACMKQSVFQCGKIHGAGWKDYINREIGWKCNPGFCHGYRVWDDGRDAEAYF